MADIVVVYASRYGQSEKVAHFVTTHFASQGHSAVSAVLGGGPGSVPDQTDLLIVVSAVYSNEHHPDVVAFLRNELPQIGAKRTALVSISLAVALGTDMGETMALDYVDEVCDLTGFSPWRVALVAGALNESRYDPQSAALLRVASWRSGLRESGDVELTDWDALAKELGRWKI